MKRLPLPPTQVLIMKEAPQDVCVLHDAQTEGPQVVRAC